MKNIVRKLLALITAAVLFVIPVSSVYAGNLQGFVGKWVLDEEEESYIDISEGNDGYLFVEYFLYRIYGVEGTARVSGDGKRAIFIAFPPSDEMGVLELEGDSLIFRMILSTDDTRGYLSDTLTKQPFVYHRE